MATSGFDIEKPVYEVRNEIVSSLTPVYGDREAKAMCRIFFENLKGWNSVDLVVKSDEMLSSFVQNEISGVVKRLLDQEPIQYIFGNAWFYGMKFKVSHDTLIPRPETAELVDIIVADYKDRTDLSVLDLCTGSGCIAIALSRNLPFSHVTAVDICEGALTIAEQNSSDLHAPVSYIKADILSPHVCDQINGTFDIIVSNPPYIADSEKAGMERNVLAYEPHQALFVPDNNPLIFYKAILEIAFNRLTHNGNVYCEINPRFAAELLKLAKIKGFDTAELILDSYGKTRFLKASKIS